MRNYLHHRRTLTILLLINMVFEMLLYTYLFLNLDFILAQLAEVYRELSYEELTLVFQVSNCADIAINVFVYVFGFYTLYSHKVSYFNIFNAILVIAIFSRIVISYLNM